MHYEFVPYESSTELVHTGVKGMRWGHRKSVANRSEFSSSQKKQLGDAMAKDFHVSNRSYRKYSQGKIGIDDLARKQVRRQKIGLALAGHTGSLVPVVGGAYALNRQNKKSTLTNDKRFSAAEKEAIKKTLVRDIPVSKNAMKHVDKIMRHQRNVFAAKALAATSAITLAGMGAVKAMF